MQFKHLHSQFNKLKRQKKKQVHIQYTIKGWNVNIYIFFFGSGFGYLTQSYRNNPKLSLNFFSINKRVTVYLNLSEIIKGSKNEFFL